MTGHITQFSQIQVDSNLSLKEQMRFAYQQDLTYQECYTKKVLKTCQAFSCKQDQLSVLYTKFVNAQAGLSQYNPDQTE